MEWEKAMQIFKNEHFMPYLFHKEYSEENEGNEKEQTPALKPHVQTVLNLFKTLLGFDQKMLEVEDSGEQNADGLLFHVVYGNEVIDDIFVNVAHQLGDKSVKALADMLYLDSPDIAKYDGYTVMFY